ncbi:hypothetical protein [Magnetococcus sp. PR-3]|uniref:hypothetical protein n=1 Tax=Magnetococcus sp. PR-3 TaxID=3120355 RepID=UPI002FCE62E6
MAYPCDACRKQIRLGRYAKPHGALQLKADKPVRFVKRSETWVCQTCGALLHAPDTAHQSHWMITGCY